MARPLDLVVEEMLDYIEQAISYVGSMTFEQLLVRPEDPARRRTLHRGDLRRLTPYTG